MNYIAVELEYDFKGEDLLKFDLGSWLSDVEEHKALVIYDFFDLIACGLGDPEINHPHQDSPCLSCEFLYDVV